MLFKTRLPTLGTPLARFHAQIQTAPAESINLFISPNGFYVDEEENPGVKKLFKT